MRSAPTAAVTLTLIFALAVIPIFGAVGVAVDYSRGNSARTAMQAALDATTLMIAKEALDLQNGQVQQKAKSYFNAQFTRSDVSNLNLTFELKTNGPGDFTVIGDATAKMDTAMAQIIGYNKMDLRTTSQVRWGFKALELALALDNTGSMASKNKMVELKAAVKLLFETLKKNSKVPGDTKIAIIPFGTVVNIGTEFKDAPWIAYDGTITSANWGGCVADRDQPNDVKDTAPGASATSFPGGRMRLAGEGPAADRRLDRARGQGRLDDAVRHDQCDDRRGVGLARAHPGRAVHARPGGAARCRQGHHPADRRAQHRQPLHQQCIADRRAHRGGLRQHQGGQDQDVHRAGDRGQCRAAAGLRHRVQHVLRRAGGEPAQGRLRLDRREPVRRAARESDRVNAA